MYWDESLRYTLNKDAITYWISHPNVSDEWHILYTATCRKEVFSVAYTPDLWIRKVPYTIELFVSVYYKKGHYLWSKYRVKLSPPYENGAELFSMIVLGCILENWHRLDASKAPIISMHFDTFFISDTGCILIYD